MKKTLLFLMLTLMGLTMAAKPVDPDRAVLIAKNFVAQYVKGADQMTATVVYTHPMPKSGQPAMYVVNVGNMFILVAADDIAHPVLGYSLSRPWPTDLGTRTSPSAKEERSLPSQVSAYLDDLAAQIESAVPSPREGCPQGGECEDIASEWRQLLTVNYQLLTTNLPDSVGPLLTTTWDQGQSYNAMCPEDPNGPDGHVYTGCVATAMAQIINYWGYPIHGRGSHSYNVSGLDAGSFYGDVNTVGYGTQYVNFDSANYDYANMPDALIATSTPQEVQAVAQLMYHSGVAVNMLYGANESGAQVEDVRGALISYYGFSPTLGYAQKQMYSNTEWTDTLRANINRGEPVFYCGSSAIVSHAFVLDGYKQDGNFHFNFGWGGYGDGWYLISAVNPSYSFNDWQSAIIGIKPDSNTHAVICHKKLNVQNVDNFIVSETLDLYPMRGMNTYRASNEMVGTRINLNFVPEDSLDQLVLDVLEFDREQSVVIYDGINNDSLIRVIETRNLDDYSTVTFRNWLYEGLPSDTIFQNIADTILSPITSTRHGLSIVVYSYGGMPEGFHLRVRNATDTISQETTTLNNRIYWTDVVTSEPDGYIIDGDTIRITTPHALAWLSYCVDSMWVNGINYTQYYQKVLSIENDLDLDGYYWTPIRMWAGNIVGHGHVIRNMNVSTSGNGGLFADIGAYEIFDLGLENAKVNAINSAGAIAGYMSNCNAINCYSKNHNISSGNSQSGGLFGTAINSQIINCYVYGDISAQYGYGGLVGYSTNSNVQNCVTRVGETFNWSTSDSWYGLLTEEVHGGSFSNCFSDISIAKRIWYSDDLDYLSLAKRAYFLGNVYNVDAIDNLAAFDISLDSLGILMSDTAVNYTQGEGMDIITALNNKVAEYNSPIYRIWERDSVTHLPVLGDFYEVTCPNVSNINVENISYNGGFAVALSWQEEGEAENWQVKYNVLNAPEDSAIVINVNAVNDTIEGLQLETDYVFYVRPICGGEDTVGWGQPNNFFVDKTLWVDMVTSCPEGYQEDSSGNITISTPEGLAWLAKIGFDYRQNTIFIMNDLDMGAYKWTPIGRYSFEGGIEGNNHVIFNIYCNEDMADNNSTGTGLIAHANNAFFNNIVIQNSSFSGNRYVGSLIGYSENSSVSNCHAINVIVKGKESVGGLCGIWSSNTDKLVNSSSSGFVYGDLDEGGLVGACGGTVINCYSNCDIKPGGFRDRWYYGGLFGSALGTIVNCYFCGNIEAGTNDFWLNVSGSFVGQTSDLTGNHLYAPLFETYPFVGRGFGELALSDTASFINSNLLNPVTIADSSYNDLLLALNAWVDAYDTAGIYRHWAADSANTNGGFPVFATVSCVTVTGSDSIVVCDSYTWHGNIYTSSTELIDTLPTLEGCDSIVTHHLIVNHSVAGTETVAACESYFFGGQWLYASGQYTDTLTNAAGCDSVAILNLTINNPVHVATTEVACDSYTWHGAPLTTSGDYTHPHTDANGCTQVDTLHLTVNYSNTGVETVTACDSYTWHGTTYTASNNTATFTEINAAGCDSAVTLNLTVNYSNTGIETVAACESYFFGGQWLYASGQYTDTLTNVAGCDSVATLNLTVNYSNTGVETVTACDSYTWHGTNYTASNSTATFTETNAAGCDSVVTLNLTVNYSNTGVETVTACDSYTWHGTAYTASNNTATFTETNAAGCDSVVTLNLTVNYSNTGVETVTACDSYTWHGTNYTASNSTATFTETNAAGCDSVVTLNLTVNYSNTGVETVTACDSYTWHGTAYTASNSTATFTETNAAGCDSVVTLNLTVNYSNTGVETVTACDSYNWIDGNTYTESNFNSQFSIFNSAGCDSVVTLNLTINHSTETTVTDTAENSYTWNGTTYTESGTYQWQGVTSDGCDSTVTLVLVINSVGIDSPHPLSLNVYPNPTTGQLTIDAEGILSVEVFDPTGRKVATHERTHTIDLGGLPAGSYLLKIHLPSGTSLQRVILK